MSCEKQKPKISIEEAIEFLRTRPVVLDLLLTKGPIQSLRDRQKEVPVTRTIRGSKRKKQRRR